MYVCMYMYIYIYTYIHTHMHAYIHTHMDMQWKNELRKRTLRLQDLSLDAPGSSRPKQLVYRHK